MKFNVERSMQDSMDTVILRWRDPGGLVRKLPFSCNNYTIKTFSGIVTISQWHSPCLACTKHWVLSPVLYKPSVLEHVCDQSASEVEERSEVQDCARPHRTKRSLQPCVRDVM